MLDHRQDLHHRTLPTAAVDDQLHETDEALLDEGADEDALLEERTVLTGNRRRVLAVMPEAFSLPDRRFVVDLGDTVDKRGVERNLPDDNALFLGFTHHIARLVVDLALPPLVECRDRKRRHIVPLDGVGVLPLA